jgi:FkbM family methyltransferase
VDVGANTGDTTVLLESHLPGICRTLCIEPDDEFFALSFQYQGHPGCHRRESDCGDSGDSVSIFQGAPRTAGTQIVSAGGSTCATLDSLAKDYAAAQGRIDAIKIDTDGFDFGILRQFFLFCSSSVSTR